jgi:mono/diheme cytochrome c family protein
MNTPSLYKSGLLLVGFISLSSCLATPKSGDATLAFYQKKALATTSATTGIGAFTDTFYNFARTNCASCHGATQAPTFAVSDVNAAYGTLKGTGFVSFANVSSSMIVTYAGNGHCGLPGCNGNAAVAAEQVQAWADVENAVAAGSGTGSGTGTGGGAVGGTTVTGGAKAGATITTSLNLPATLPTGTTYVPMRWQLSSVTPANALVAGAVFELEVQKLSATTYRVRNPKIAGLKSPVRVTGIHVFVKAATDTGIGVEDLGAGSVWENDVVSVPVTTLPGTLPATPLSITTFVPMDSFSMVIGVRSNQDAFTVSFDTLATAVSLTPTFASINSNILATKCVSCHSTNSKAGGFSYSNYTDTQASVSSGNPAGSALYTSVTGGQSMPIGSLKLTAAETAAISTWITNGAANN